MGGSEWSKPGCNPHSAMLSYYAPRYESAAASQLFTTMNRQLIIVRHAKSCWDDPGLDDFDRPLNGRGKRNAPEMGRRLQRSGIQPDLMISSPALRALKTARAIARELAYPKSAIRTDFDLYMAGAATLLRVLRGQDDHHRSIMLFSHNSGITDFANLLSSYYLDNLPTAGLLGLSFQADSWADLAPGSGQFGFYDYPRNLVPELYRFH